MSHEARERFFGRDSIEPDLSSAARGQPPAPLTCEATLLYLLDVLWPKNTSATRHTTAMSPTRKAYSTRLAPRSLLRRHLYARYLAMATRFTAVALER